MKYEFRWALRTWAGETIYFPMPGGLLAVLQVRIHTDDAGWSEWQDLPMVPVLS